MDNKDESSKKISEMKSGDLTKTFNEAAGPPPPPGGSGDKKEDKDKGEAGSKTKDHSFPGPPAPSNTGGSKKKDSENTLDSTNQNTGIVPPSKFLPQAGQGNTPSNAEGDQKINSKFLPKDQSKDNSAQPQQETSQQSKFLPKEDQQKTAPKTTEAPVQKPEQQKPNSPSH